MVDKAIIVKNKIKEMKMNGKRKTSFSEQSAGSNTRPRLPQLGPFFRNPSMVCSSMHGQCPPFHMQWPSVQQLSRQNVQQSPRPIVPTSQIAPAQAIMAEPISSVGWLVILHGSSWSQKSEKPQGQQNFMYGKVNHMTSDEAQQAQDVILGMFLASSHPATVLFDSGASHSFLTSSFDAKHNLLI
jgi:hypothetical protein